MSVSSTFEVLADPTRRQIVAFLADGESPVRDIVDQFNSSAPAISQHLKVLREAGLVTVRPVAQQRFYAVNRVALAECAAWLMRMGGFWSDQLGALEKDLRQGRLGD
jgi:DNA-binding transcriptional ArsR family regulator